LGAIQGREGRIRPATIERITHADVSVARDGDGGGDLRVVRGGFIVVMENHARFGYSFLIRMTYILKRRNFARWQSGEKLPDAALGGSLYKKRVARPGSGKSGGYRMLLSARIGSRYVFLHGFPKSDKANITQDEKKALQFAGKVFLELSSGALSKALQSGVLLEVRCEHDR
jgi:hypothetical protein